MLIHKKENISVRFVLKESTLTLIFLLIILWTILWVNMILSLREEVNNLGVGQLELIATDFKAQIERVDTYMASLEIDHAAFHRLGVKGSELAVFDDVSTIKKEFSNRLDICSNLNAIIIYSAPNQLEYLSYGNLNYMTQSERQKFIKSVRTSFAEALEEKPYSRKSWSFKEENGQYLLYKTVRYEGVYCTAVFDLDMVLEGHADEDSPYFLFFQKEDGEVISNNNISINSAMVYGEAMGPLRMGLELRHGLLFEYGRVWIIGLILGSVLLIILIVLVWRQINRRILQPVNQLVDTMDAISKGQKEFGTGEDLQCEEFIQLSETFNKMMLEIKHLQIEQYENELKAQKLQLTNLQGQIRLHFYLNCLKNVYALAEKERYESIKNTVLALSRHLRYIFAINEAKIDLRNELSFIDNYVELYRCNFSRLVFLNIEVSEELMDFLVPPISLLTFLENSIKYSNLKEGALKIGVTARKIKVEQKTKLNLTFRDNGNGFSQEMLEILNRKDREFGPTEHVGINNVLYRCKLLYQNEFFYGFFNEGGAVVDLYFPIDG